MSGFPILGNLANGAASGDLTGSYPNPTVAKIQGTAISSAIAGELAAGTLPSYLQLVGGTMSGPIIIDGNQVIPDLITHTTLLIPSGGDDTSAIESAMSTLAAAAIADGSYLMELVFTEGTYIIGGALVQGGTAKCNAQIPIPMVAQANGAPLVIVLRGPKAGAAADGSIKPTSGAILQGTLTGQSYSGTYGIPCLMGGPDALQSATFTDVLLIFDNVNFRLPDNPSYSAVNCQRVAGVAFNEIRIDTNVAGYLNVTYPTHPQAIGFLMPGVGNNGHGRGHTLWVEGFYGGCAPAEHTDIDNFICILCVSPICPVETQYHTLRFGYCNIGEVSYVLAALNPASGITGLVPTATQNVSMVIESLDIEDATAGYLPAFQVIDHIYDPNNSFFGKINFARVVAGSGIALGLTVSSAVGAPPPVQLTDLNDGNWVTLSLGNGWTNVGGTRRIASAKIVGGVVYLDGLITGGSYPITITSVPTRMIPLNQVDLCALTFDTTGLIASAAWLAIHSVSGALVIANTSPIPTYISLSGLSYRVDA